MRLFGIGIDVVEIERFEQSISRQGERFLQRVFLGEELSYCERQRRPGIHYAARFAAKEAVSKALGTGIGEKVGWQDILIQRLDSGEPQVVLQGDGKDYAESCGVVSIHISLTHTDHYAAANAVAMAGEV